MVYIRKKLLAAVLPVIAAAETTPVKVVRVGSFEDLRSRRIRSFPSERGLSLFLAQQNATSVNDPFVT